MQEINFYQTLTKPSRYAINAKRAQWLLGIIILFLLMIVIVTALYLGFQSLRLSRLTQQEKNISAQITFLIKNTPKIKYVRELENTIVAFTEKINHQTDFIQKMSDYSAHAMQFKPADYLKELASATTPQVWLTHIQIQKQGQAIYLAGLTLSTSQLTQFVLQLQHQPNFKNKPFAKLAVTDTQTIEQTPFVLSTEDKKP